MGKISGKTVSGILPYSRNKVNNMIKVLQVNKLYYPHIGGIETVVRNIAEGLKNRTDMKVLVCRRNRGKTIDENINGRYHSRL